VNDKFYVPGSNSKVKSQKSKVKSQNNYLAAQGYCLSSKLNFWLFTFWILNSIMLLSSKWAYLLKSF